MSNNANTVSPMSAYWDSLGLKQKQAFSDACERKLSYMRHVARDRKIVSAKLAIVIEKESGGKVPKESLRPDLFDVGAVSCASGSPVATC